MHLDLTGRRFGRLVAVKMYAKKYKRTKWLCKCDCGVEKLIPLGSLTSGRAKSCGCYRKEVTSAKRKKHLQKDERLYGIWLNLRNRCFNPNLKSYKDYGQRGITVCKEWDDFGNFSTWALNNGYREDLTIDRIDNDGNYEPSNCRWATRDIQANNKSDNVRIVIDGVERTIANHARYYKIPYDTFYYRYENGWNEKDLVKPVIKKKLIEIDGEIKSLKAWSRHFGISYSTVQHRYKKGIRGKKLFFPVNEEMSRKAKARRKRESV